jgi:hypothetical protein
MFAAQGKLAEARAAYETAIKQSETSQKTNGNDQAPTGSNYRDMLRAKLEHLGSAK